MTSSSWRRLRFEQCASILSQLVQANLFKRQKVTFILFYFIFFIISSIFWTYVFLYELLHLGTNIQQLIYSAFLIGWWCHNCITLHVMNLWMNFDTGRPSGKIWSSTLLTLLSISGDVGWQCKGRAFLTQPLINLAHRLNLAHKTYSCCRVMKYCDDWPQNRPYAVLCCFSLSGSVETQLFITKNRTLGIKL